MPGAQCTRSLVCESSGWNAHEYSQRVHRKRPAFPHAMVLRLIPRSPRWPALLPPSPADYSADLNTSIGVSGPHGFAVRLSTVRQRRIRVHRIPLQRSW